MARRIQTTSGSRVDTVHFKSVVLKGNALSDPPDRQISLYLPPGYDLDANRSRRYPVVYFLSGFTGRGRMMLNATGWGESLDRRIDRLIKTRRMKPVIGVLPDCFTRLGGSQYLDSSATGKYETHLVRELVPWVDDHYRTMAKAKHRAVTGKSSGGYGALVLGMKHPDVFGLVASHSGDCGFEYAYLPDFPRLLDQVRIHGSVRRFVRAFDLAPKKTHELLTGMNILAMAACYSPNPRAKATLGIDLPFDLETGAMRPVIWRRWLRHDPLRMVAGHKRQLKKLRFLFLDCGLRDEWNLNWGARMLSAELTRYGIKHIHQEFDDGHMDIPYRFDVSLPLISRHIG
jgi:enterochelin esterase family protein